MFQELANVSAYDRKLAPDSDGQDHGTASDIENKKTIAAIRAALPSYMKSLDGKTFVHEGGVIELDSDSHRPICRVFLFVFSDLLIIAKVKHDK